MKRYLKYLLFRLFVIYNNYLDICLTGLCSKATHVFEYDFIKYFLTVYDFMKKKLTVYI